jgi:hypothetical protein
MPTTEATEAVREFEVGFDESRWTDIRVKCRAWIPTAAWRSG